MKKLAILGASGHGCVIADIALQSGWDEIVFFDDAFPEKTQVKAWPVSGNTDMLVANLAAYDGVVVGIGHNRVRQQKMNLLLERQAPLVSIIHPSAVISTFAQIGVGSVVMPLAIINIGTTIGNACIVNSSAVVEHDCQIGDAVHIGPNAALGGGVRIAMGAWIGIGANIRHLESIGEYATVGAGATVVSTVAAHSTVVGTPARIISV